MFPKKLAKPAVPFGGKYRIIDFPLSNCVNSGIDAVGILTQYQPLVLNEYIGNGQPWDLDSMHSGVNCLSPYQAVDGADWYSGTANAIYQNINYIERYEFEEKPAHPKSTNASMGIYIFSWKELKKYLTEDEFKEGSSHDFGKDVLPAMLDAGERMFAYPFEGYWKDVGTIDSLWEANMDLLDPKVTLDLKDIYSRNPMMPPHYVSNEASIQNSLVADGCNVYGNLEFSILFAGVTIGKNATINSSIIMPGAVIEDGAEVQFAIIAENTVVGKNAKVGQNPEETENIDDWGITVVGANTVIKENTVIKAKTMIDSDTEVDGNEK